MRGMQHAIKGDVMEKLDTMRQVSGSLLVDLKSVSSSLFHALIQAKGVSETSNAALEQAITEKVDNPDSMPGVAVDYFSELQGTAAYNFKKLQEADLLIRDVVQSVLGMEELFDRAADAVGPAAEAWRSAARK